MKEDRSRSELSENYRRSSGRLGLSPEPSSVPLSEPEPAFHSGTRYRVPGPGYLGRGRAIRQ